MAKIGDMISLLQVGNIKYNNPVWWSAKHKLKKDLRLKKLFEANISLKSSYTVNNADEFSSSRIIANYKRDLELPQYKELAPWNAAFRKYKTLIIPKK